MRERLFSEWFCFELLLSAFLLSLFLVHSACARVAAGAFSGGETPGPIPNPVVQPASAYVTTVLTPWESQSVPAGLSGPCIYPLFSSLQIFPRVVVIFTRLLHPLLDPRGDLLFLCIRSTP